MIRLDGVAVPTVEREFLDYEAYDHQAAAEDLISGSKSFFAVNESPTGSGKTFSWLKPALDEGVDSIAVFPTNALIADQIQTARELVNDHYEEDDVGIIQATGATISEWRSEFDVSTKGEALARKVDESTVRNDTTVLFTNPDTLVIVRKGMYHHEFVSNKFDRFEMVVLDEFHLADVKQRDTLLFLLDEMYELPDNQSRTDRFFFLSATPEDDDNQGRSLVTRIREDIREDPHRISADRRPVSDVEDANAWIPVMPEVNLHLRESQTFKTADEILSDEHVDEFCQFCQGGQTVVMLDGVHEVDQVYDALDDNGEGMVRRITGFHKGDVSSKVDDFDILVSNSAVEVGLDFQPDRLVFSAHDAASLIQRLGRLRYKEGNEALEAWCYVPGPVRAKIQAELSGGDYGVRVSRNEFEQVIQSSFGEKCDLSSFSERWGELEAYQHVKERVDNVPGEKTRSEVMDRGIARIKRHYYEPYGRRFARDDLERLHNWTDYNLIDELKTYRGSGLQVMVKDEVDENNSMKLYDMFYLLRWGEVQFMDPKDFKSVLTSEERGYFEVYTDYAVGYCTYNGKISTETTEDDSYPGRSVALEAEGPALHSMKHASDAEREPSVVDGLSVDVENGEAPPVVGIDLLREELTKAQRLCYVVPGHTSAVEATYGLDDFFFLYQLGEDSVAIGLNALYLHCLVQDRIESEEREWGWDE